ncbi:MAG: hypothetical protein F4Y30_10410 [Chloroflexi bacterium]|nr:hypothetical protein [Chloroflexota bacterium]MYD38909.1 hypothetical protein [Chloroflexota bacterium]MYH64916.1 hypothetical protein [Chloroflexota bacterium]
MSAGPTPFCSPTARPTMRILTLFLDGIGLGADDALHNPFALPETPNMRGLSNGRRWLARTGFQQSERALFIPTDARLGVAGRPQSGSGQAALLTGVNVPEILGRHYGPKPDARTREIIRQRSLFLRLRNSGKSARSLTAYPARLQKDWQRGKTLRSSIQLADYVANGAHFGIDDIRARRALTAEWTTEGWRRHLQASDLPEYSPAEAGRLLAKLAGKYDFALHSHWMTDRIGHRGTVEAGVGLLERFDALLGGLLAAWDDEAGLIVITSDHGNMEDLNTRRHTLNAVPTVVVGSRAADFAQGYRSLTDFAPACERLLRHGD